MTTFREFSVRERGRYEHVLTGGPAQELPGAGDGHPGPARRGPDDDAINAALGGGVEAPAPTGLQLLPLRLSATLHWVPVALAVATVFGALALPLVLSPVTPLGVIAFGIVVGTAAWLVHGALTDGSVRPDRANPASYEALRMRLAVVDDDLRQHLRTGALRTDAAPVRQFAELKTRLAASPPAGDWSSGEGYVIAWCDLHRIEEELIATIDESRLEGILSRDEGRIDGSKLARKSSPVSRLIEDAKEARKAKTLDANRGLLRAIRQAVNEFRDGNFRGLVENRSHLERVSMFLGLIAWAILCIAVLTGASIGPVVAVSVLYLVGAGAGLLTQLSGTKATTSSENIFGYGQAEVRLTILASGLAAVGGAFLTWVLVKTSQDAIPTDLAGAFVLSPFNLLTAAAFGLAPGTLLERVTSWAKTNIDDLESTSGTETKEA